MNKITKTKQVGKTGPVLSNFSFESGALVKRLLSNVPERAREVLVRRFGLGTKPGRETLEAIGNLFGITRERVRQIEQKTLARLRHPHNSANLRAFMDDN